jgi:Caspase domain
MTDVPTYRALLVGVWDYAVDSGFESLHGPRNDVRELGRILRDPKVGLFTVKELLNPSTGALRTGVQKFLDLAGKNDNLLVYFSGHGESSTKTGQLCLTSAEGDKAALDGSSLSFAECYEWVRDSPAQSITIILDCCRAGSSFKGGGPDFDGYFGESGGGNGPRQPKIIKILSVGSGYESISDARTATDTSPFTELLCKALENAATADENGLVSLHSVAESIRDMTTESMPVPRVWGTEEVAGPYLAQRPEYMLQLLDTAGLRPFGLKRAGAANSAGRDVHVGVMQVGHVVNHLTNRYPATAYVGGPVGSGKTWILCDVSERLLDQGWQVVALQPSREPADAQKLWSAFKKYAAGLKEINNLTLIIIDGIEWSEVWAEFVSGLHELVESEGFGVSVLASLETQRGQLQAGQAYKSWQTGPLYLPAVVQGGVVADFIAAVMSPESSPAYVTWDHARLDRARGALRELTGTDLWAIAHLGPVWHEPAAEEVVIRAVWRERIGNITPRQVRALQTVAALSRFNLWSPLPLVAEAGEILFRLGAEYSRNHDSVRLNSGFLDRAILVRRLREGKVTFEMDRRAAERTALPIIARYLRDVLRDENRQQEAVAVLSRLGYDRRVLSIVLRMLRNPSAGGPSVWEHWADNWTDLAPVVQILSVVRTVLPTADATTLGNRLCTYVVENGGDELALPTLTACLELLRNFHRGKRAPAELSQAYELLALLAERQLESDRWSPRLRRRLLRVLRLLKRLDDEAIQRIGPMALRPLSPPGIPDMTLVLDFAKLVSPGRNNETLRGQLATWDVVADELVRSPESDDVTVSPERLAVRRALARYIYDDESAEHIGQVLATRMRTAAAADLERVLSTCIRLDRRYAAELVGTLNLQDWPKTIYRAALPYTMARLLSALGRIRPDLAGGTLRLPDSRPDSHLAEVTARAIRSDSDPVSAGMLLKTAARLEEQQGTLYGGFGQLFCAELGADFLADILRNDSRLSVVNHLVEAYAAVRSPLLETSRQSLLEIVEAQINSSNSENGARLALILSNQEALGESFIMELRARQNILPATILARMRDVRNPGALIAYHELGVLLFPLIEFKFLEEIEESGNPWNKTKLFDDLATEGNVVASLRAASAVTTTLVLCGKTAPGRVILDAFQRAWEAGNPGADWTNRVLEADDFELAEGLRLLYRLQPSEAQRLAERYSTRVLSAMRDSPARVLADLLSAIVEISPDAGNALTDQCEDKELISEALDDLLAESDLWEQAAALGSLTTAENRLFRHIVPGQMAERFCEYWVGQVSVINNPQLAAEFIRISGNRGREAALTVANAVNVRSLRRRLDRQNVADAAGYASLIRLLGELTPNAVPMLVDDRNARYLLWQAPVNGVAGLAETLITAGVLTAGGLQEVVGLRLNLASDKVPMRSRRGYWLGMGWNAWLAARHGVPLKLDEPLDPRIVASMDPYAMLWALAWLRPDDWVNDAISKAIKRLRNADQPPSRPSAAAGVLTAACALGKETDLLGANPAMSRWQHALEADPWWIRAMVAAAQPGSQLHETLRREWSPHRVRIELAWQSHGWRKVPLEAEALLLALLRAREARRIPR